MFNKLKKFYLLICLIFTYELTSSLFSEQKLFPISPYVVGKPGFADYHTIQSALDEASKNGGGSVVIQPGVYEEEYASTKPILTSTKRYQQVLELLPTLRVRVRGVYSRCDS